MRRGFIWLIVLLVVTLLAMLVVPVILSIFTGGGFDPS